MVMGGILLKCYFAPGSQSHTVIHFFSTSVEAVPGCLLGHCNIFSAVFFLLLSVSFCKFYSNTGCSMLEYFLSSPSITSSRSLRAGLSDQYVFFALKILGLGCVICRKSSCALFVHYQSLWVLVHLVQTTAVQAPQRGGGVHIASETRYAGLQQHIRVRLTGQLLGHR